MFSFVVINSANLLHSNYLTWLDAGNGSWPKQEPLLAILLHAVKWGLNGKGLLLAWRSSDVNECEIECHVILFIKLLFPELRQADW